MNHRQYPGQHQNQNSLYSLLRQISLLGRQARIGAEAITAARLRGDLEAERELLYQLPSLAFDIETTASMVPVTVMFADLRGFTGLVEEYPPNQVIHQLNEYFSSMTRIIVEHGGILDKYMGDEIMAYFEAQNPLEYCKSAYCAVFAGIRMMETLERLNKKWDQRGWPVLQSGIGINSGPVLKGNIGSMVKMETTIIGDAVNVASRLQQMNKDLGSRLLMSGSTQQLVQGEFPVRSMGELSVRGRRKPVTVYELDLKAYPLLDKSQTYMKLFPPASSQA